MIMKNRNFLLIYIALMALLLAACSTPKPFDEFSGDIQPIEENPETEPNVTPHPTENNAFFTVKVTRIGKQAPNIGWAATGEIYLKVNVDSDSPLNVMGTGFGKAGFDASNKVCQDAGGWPVEYAAEGYFDKKNCTITIKVVETWPQTEAHAQCFGQSGSASGGIYTLEFPGLKFEDDDPRKDTKLTQDMIEWVNTFELTVREGIKKTDGCLFEEIN
jgi:hypothetical protein